MIKWILWGIIRLVEKTKIIIIRNFTNLSLFYLFLITFSLINLEIKISNLGINISDVNTKIKFKEVGKFINNLTLWEGAVPQNLPSVNFDNCIININGINSFDINLLHTTIANYQNPNNNLFIIQEHWDLWVKLLKKNPQHYFNINLDTLLNTQKTYNDVSRFRSYFIIMGSFLVFSDFVLKNVFI